MYTIKDGKLILKSVFDAHGITNDITIALPSDRYATSSIDDYIKYSIDHMKASFNIEEQYDYIVRDSYLTLNEPVRDVVDMPVTDTVLEQLSMRLKTSVANLKSDINKRRSNIVYSVANESYACSTDLLGIHTDELKLKLTLDFINLLDMLQADVVEHLYIQDSASVQVQLAAVLSREVKFTATVLQKEVKYNYVSLTKIPTQQTPTSRDLYNIICDLQRERFPTPATRCIKLSKASRVKDSAATVPSIDIYFLCPRLKQRLQDLKKYAFVTFKSPKGSITEGDTLTAHWLLFQGIKVDLMLNGFSEMQAIDFINESVPLGTIARCEITMQAMPKYFLTQLKLEDGTIIECSMYYIWMAMTRRNYDDTPRYTWDTDKYVETISYSAVHKYYSRLHGHTKSTLDYLTPMSAKGEHTEAYNENKGYRPTPFLGVELEVERLDTQLSAVPVEYPLNPATGVIQSNEIRIQKAVEPKKTPLDITETVLANLGQDFAILKSDGSLRGEMPFEIVTVPATLAAHKQRWQRFMNDKEMKSSLQSFKSGNCGMHVHVSRNSFTGLHLAKFIRFINCDENYNFITALAQRGGNRFANYDRKFSLMQSAKIGADGIGAEDRNRDTRYKAVNVCNKQTIEVRIFRGNLGTVQFFKNLEFVHAVWQYTLTASIQELGYKEFLFWLFDTKNTHHKDYANLQKWLVKSDKATLVASPIRKETPKELKPKLIERRKAIKKLKLLNVRKYSPSKKAEFNTETTEEILQSA